MTPSRRPRAALLNTALGVIVLAGAGGAYAAVQGGSDAPAAGSTSRTATVARATVQATVSGSGSLFSPSDAGASFVTGGTLTEVDVKPGDKVTKGQVLAKVDATNAKATLAQDQASLTAAQADLTKVEEGELPAATGNGAGATSRSGAGIVPATPTPSYTPTVDPAQLAQAEAQVTQAQNTVAAARRAVDGCVLTAPVAGTVASVAGAKGDTVSGTGGNGGSTGASSGSGSGGGGSAASTGSSAGSGAPTGFVVLTNPAGMQVKADFSETDALKLKSGQAATVSLNAEPGTVLDAKVLSVSSLPVGSSGAGGGSGGGGSSGSAVQYEAVLTVTGSTANLRTGLSASIQVVTGQAAGVLSVPTAAVSGTGANRTVLVIGTDGTTTRVPVTVGLEGDNTDQITSGLAEGQRVEIPSVASAGNGGFPSGAFPGGLGGGGNRFGGGSLRGGGGGRG